MIAVYIWETLETFSISYQLFFLNSIQTTNYSVFYQDSLGSFVFIALSIPLIREITISESQMDTD